MKKLFYLLMLFCFVASCDHNSQSKTENLTRRAVTQDKQTNEIKTEQKVLVTAKSDRTSNLLSSVNPSASLAKVECIKTNTGDNVLLESQTFPYDSKPFESSCLVVSHNPEYDNPPTALTLSLYKNDVEIYKFDRRFYENSVTCTLNVVAFEDLNNDMREDVIVARKCGTKTSDIIANEVFINAGEKTFYTNIAANDRLEKFDKI